MKSSRMIVAALLVVLGVAVGASALVSLYSRTRVLAPGAFAQRVATSLDEPAVQTLVASRVHDLIVQRGGAAIDAPALTTAVRKVLGSSSLRSVARVQVSRAQRRLIDDTRANFVVDLSPAVPLVAAELRRRDPARASALDAFSGPLDVAWTPPVGSTTLGRAIDLVRLVAVAGPVIAAALLAIALALAPRRRLLLAWAGLLVVAAAITGLYAMQRLRTRALERVPSDAPAYGAIWDAVVEGLRAWWIVALGVGVFALIVGLMRPIRR